VLICITADKALTLYGLAPHGVPTFTLRGRVLAWSFPNQRLRSSGVKPFRHSSLLWTAAAEEGARIFPTLYER